MSEKPRISVIIPVYNTEDYLEACVRSLLAQTFGSFELLLIDDGSTDGSSLLCDELAKKDARIRVIHQKNGGVSRARNRGLSEAKGDYICFTDSDDQVSPDFLESFLHRLSESGAGMAGCAYTGCGEGEELVTAFPEPAGAVPAADFLARALSAPDGFFLTVWNWIFPRALIGDLKFSEELRYGEDSLFLCQMLKRAGTLSFDGTHRYYYRTAREGNTFGNLSAAKQAQMVRAFTEIAALFHGENDLLDAALSRMLLDRCLLASHAYRQEGEPVKAERLKAQARRCYRELRDNPKAGRRDKLVLWFKTR